MSKHNCPVCNKENLVLRHEATYIYSYLIDENAPGKLNEETFKSFQYDKREQKDSREYIECEVCGSQFPSNYIFNVLENIEKDSMM